MKNRNKVTNIRSKYTKIPNKVFSVGLSPVALSVYVALCHYSEDFDPTLRNLSNLLHVHRNTIARALKELEDRKVINKIFQGFVIRHPGTQVPSDESRQSLYEFTETTEWTKKGKVPKRSSVIKDLTLEIIED